MAWNEPGGGNRDPWSGGGRDQGPPDLDEVVRKLSDRFNSLIGGRRGGGSGGGSGGGASGSGLAGIGLVVGIIAVIGWLIAKEDQAKRSRMAMLYLMMTQRRGSSGQGAPEPAAAPPRRAPIRPIPGPRGR